MYSFSVPTSHITVAFSMGTEFLFKISTMISIESFCVIPMAKGNSARLEMAVRDLDNIVVMKAFDSMGIIVDILKRNSVPLEKATVMCDVGTEKEYIGPIDLNREFGYFTTVLIKKN